MIRLDDDDIDVIMNLARELTGTNVNKTHHSVIVQNVTGRLLTLKCKNLTEYLQYIDNHDEEMSHLLSALTIHTTGWFRENAALEKLEEIVPEYWKKKDITQKTFRVLSIACSTGEEVYSIAGILEAYRSTLPGFEYSVEGWDIDPISLLTAREAQYDLRNVNSIPDRFRGIIFENHVSESAFQKVNSSIRQRVRFRTVNVMKAPLEEDQYDYIVCRNMLIYFEPSDVEKIMSQIRSRLVPSGFFCVGVSETSGVAAGTAKPVGSATYIPISVRQKLPIPPARRSNLKIIPHTEKKEKAILVVDDENVLRDLMVDHLKDEKFEVVGAANTQEALEICRHKKFGLVFSDFRMPPGKNGIELCRAMRRDGYTGAFVIISGHADRQMVEEGTASGCNEVILKPISFDELTRLAQSYVGNSQPKMDAPPNLLLFGASTGGTEVLARMLSNLPPRCPPVLVVQHITSGFAADFAQRLAKVSGLALGSMKNDETLVPGRIYIPLGEYHIGVKSVGGSLRLIVSDEPPINSHKPSVDFLFSSASETSHRIFAALMTGMGRDGARGLLKLRHQGADTCAQNEETSVVFGMPKEAIRLQAAIFSGSPEDIRVRLDQRLRGENVTPIVGSDSDYSKRSA